MEKKMRFFLLCGMCALEWDEEIEIIEYPFDAEFDIKKDPTCPECGTKEVIIDDFL